MTRMFLTFDKDKFKKPVYSLKSVYYYIVFYLFWFKKMNKACECKSKVRYRYRPFDTEKRWICNKNVKTKLLYQSIE